VATAAATGAERIEWNLDDLYAGLDDPQYARDADEALAAATRFREQYAGRVAELDHNDLAAATAEFERIVGLVHKAGQFVELRFEANATEENGAALQRANEHATAVQTELLFFDLEWARVDDAAAERLLGHERLEPYRHALMSRRRFREHLLSEPEERIAAQKAITGIDTWRRFYVELLSRLKVPIDEGEISFAEATSRLETVADRDERRRTAKAIAVGLENEARMRAVVLNAVVNDRAVEDRLRGYATWISAFNLQHEISDDAVDTLVDAVIGRYDIARRHFRLRARLLGLDRLASYDVAAPIGGDVEIVPWERAQEIILDAYGAFSPHAREIVERAFTERWIDAALRPAKAPGAFCTRPAPGSHPFVLVNYTGDRRAVATVAHELGHALHAVLAQPGGYLNGEYPLTVAETASVFGESLTYDTMRAREPDPRVQLELIVSQLDTFVRTAFMPIAGNRFEHALHTARRAEGDLGVERISAIWLDQFARYWGDAVEGIDDRALWWSAYPHFVYSPGYMYPYAFGLLLSFSIYRRWVDEGDAFVEPILEFLRAGASKAPSELARGVGFDLSDPAFWERGLDAIDALVAEAEALADRVAD
jgi:oligoendopeptidase F